ncbi:hypothetical protein [Bacillus sp. SH5-2]|nr:hypothetical protein [Bacillus sp. SH5-2]
MSKSCMLEIAKHKEEFNTKSREIREEMSELIEIKDKRIEILER